MGNCFEAYSTWNVQKRSGLVRMLVKSWGFQKLPVVINL